jgi:peroxin-7
MDPSCSDKQLTEIVCLNNVSGMSDCSWSELNQSHILTGCCDGMIALWDVNTVDGQPLCRWIEHVDEVVGVDWNIIDKDSFLSASLDGTIKLFRPEMFDSLSTFKNDVSPTSIMWSPHNQDAFTTAMVDGSIRLWDTRQSSFSSSIMAHTGEALTADYDK